MRPTPLDLRDCKTMRSLKKWAKNLKKERGIPHTEALEEVAQRAGFQSYKQCRRAWSAVVASDV